MHKTHLKGGRIKMMAVNDALFFAYLCVFLRKKKSDEIYIFFVVSFDKVHVQCPNRCSRGLRK